MYVPKKKRLTFQCFKSWDVKLKNVGGKKWRGLCMWMW